MSAVLLKKKCCCFTCLACTSSTITRVIVSSTGVTPYDPTYGAINGSTVTCLLTATTSVPTSKNCRFESAALFTDQFGQPISCVVRLNSNLPGPVTTMYVDWGPPSSSSDLGTGASGNIINVSDFCAAMTFSFSYTSSGPTTTVGAHGGSFTATPT
jgi:hypothetical protein